MVFLEFALWFFPKVLWCAVSGGRGGGGGGGGGRFVMTTGQLM